MRMALGTRPEVKSVGEGRVAHRLGAVLSADGDLLVLDDAEDSDWHGEPYRQVVGSRLTSSSAQAALVSTGESDLRCTDIPIFLLEVPCRPLMTRTNEATAEHEKQSVTGDVRDITIWQM
jgi:hypothetical protein